MNLPILFSPFILPVSKSRVPPNSDAINVANVGAFFFIIT